MRQKGGEVSQDRAAQPPFLGDGSRKESATDFVARWICLFMVVLNHKLVGGRGRSTFLFQKWDTPGIVLWRFQWGQKKQISRFWGLSSAIGEILLTRQTKSRETYLAYLYPRSSIMDSRSGSLASAAKCDATWQFSWCFFSHICFIEIRGIIWIIYMSHALILR